MTNIKIGVPQPELPPVLAIGKDQLTLAVPTPRFSTALFTDWHIAPRCTTSGLLNVSAWTEQQISEYFRNVDRFEKVGSRIVAAARVLGRWKTQQDLASPGGVIGWLCAYRRIPLTEPSDRMTHVERSYFER